MSINHFSSSDLPEALWWAQPQHHNMEPTAQKTSSSSKHHNHLTLSHHPSNTTAFWPNSQVYHHPISAAQNSAFGFDLNNEDDEETTDDQQLTDEHIVKEEQQEQQQQGHYLPEEQVDIPKEPLFEKPLTPSDVGKLNRLVIPKQHAEKYFPLNGNDSGEKGILLSFDDELGKPWRFRYSYWNSSQSYVLTKGWSRFVKEKRLDAGDVVLFERHRFNGDRLFIGWRRRSAAGNPVADNGVVAQLGLVAAGGGGGGGGGGGWTRLFYSEHPYPAAAHPNGPAIPYQPDCLHSAAAASVLQSQTTTPSANSKRLRLFGVNLECQPDESEPATPDDGSSGGSSNGQAHCQNHHYQQYYPKVHHAYNHHNHMQDFNFSGDVNHTRYRKG